MARARRCCKLNLALHVIAFALATSLTTTAAFAAADANLTQLRDAAEKGFVPQEVELARDYFCGCGVPLDASKAAYWYQRAAESGDPEAENEIGFMYQSGVGVKADPARAMHWYQLSAASGFPLAKVNLGVLYVWGIGIQKDYAMAIQLFREAASKGSGAAASYLGDMYFFGMGLAQDRAAAESWYATGVTLHDPFAAYNLGLLFSGKNGHPINFEKAADLLRQSSAGGYVPAMHSLGLLLVRHPDLGKSPEEARSELEKASNAGFWKASTVLGLLARDEKATDASLETAYYYFQLAILQGGDPATRLLSNDLKVLSTKLTAEQATALTSDAGAWYRQHPMTLDFIYRNDDNGKRFPAWARSVQDPDLHAGQLVPHPPA